MISSGRRPVYSALYTVMERVRMFILMEEIGIKVITHQPSCKVAYIFLQILCTPLIPLLMQAHPSCKYCVYLVTYSVWCILSLILTLMPLCAAWGIRPPDCCPQRAPRHGQGPRSSVSRLTHGAWSRPILHGPRTLPPPWTCGGVLLHWIPFSEEKGELPLIVLFTCACLYRCLSTPSAVAIACLRVNTLPLYGQMFTHWCVHTCLQVPVLQRPTRYPNVWSISGPSDADY